MIDMSIPLVSVVMPVRNAIPYLNLAIQSVIEQTFCDWEMVIVDDASTDDSLQLLLSIEKKDPRVSVIALSSCRGVSFARNTAVAKARGRYIAFLDADDVWLAEKLEMQLAALLSHKAKFCATSYSRIDELGRYKGSVNSVNFYNYTGVLLKWQSIGLSTVLVERAKLIDNYFDEKIYFAEDYELWCRMLSNGSLRKSEAIGVSQSLVQYRVHSKGKSANKFYHAVCHFNVYRSMNFNILQSSVLVFNYCLVGLYQRVRSYLVK